MTGDVMLCSNSIVCSAVFYENINLLLLIGVLLLFAKSSVHRDLQRNSQEELLF
jgi:hypothetical protein